MTIEQLYDIAFVVAAARSHATDAEYVKEIDPIITKLIDAAQGLIQERDEARAELAKLKELVASCVRNCMECSYAHECQTCYWVRTSGIKLGDESMAEQEGR